MSIWKNVSLSQRAVLLGINYYKVLQLRFWTVTLPMAFFFKETVLKFHIVQKRNFLFAWAIVSDIHETLETGRLARKKFQVKNSINIGLSLNIGRKHDITVTTKLKSTSKVYLFLVIKERCRTSTEDLAEQNTDDYKLLFMFPASVPNTNKR